MKPISCILIGCVILTLLWSCETTQQGVTICDSTFVVRNIVNLKDSVVITHDTIHLRVVDHKDSITSITTYKDSVRRIVSFDIATTGWRKLVVPDGANSDVIRQAVISAGAIHGGVFIPAGNFPITKGIIPVNNVSIDVERYATFHVPAGYVGGVWELSAGANEYISISGGRYVQDGTAGNWSAIKSYQSGPGNYVVFCNFSNMIAYNATALLDINLVNGAFYNGNTHDNLIAHHCEYGVRELADRTKDNWFDGNYFHNLQIEAGENSRYGVYQQSGQQNIYNPYICWDMTNNGSVFYFGDYCADNYVMQGADRCVGFVNRGGNNTYLFKNKNIGNL